MLDAPPRPYATPDHPSERAWPSFEDLAEALPGGSGCVIEPDGSGNWVRFVPRTMDIETAPNGQRTALIEDVPRYVALSRGEAKARSAQGVETDYWDGFTWWRRGQKPERDLFVAQQQAVRRNVRRVPLNELGAPIDDADPAPTARKKE